MQSTETSKAKPAKKKQPKGPIRWKGFIPLGVLIAGLVVYFVFFFDLHLRRALEFVGTKLNGARVDISYLKTSFWNGTFELKKLEVANPQVAMKNRFEITRIHFSFAFKPLLSKKLVIPEMGIEDILYGTDRTYSGLVPDSGGGPGFLEEILTKAYANLRSQFQDNPLKKVGVLFGSFDIDSELRKVKADLGAVKYAREIQNDITQSTADLTAQVNGLANADTVNQYRARVEAITKRQFKKPDDIKRALDDVNKVRSDVDQEVKKVEQVHSTVTNKSNELTTKVGNIDNKVNEDINQIRSKLKLPNFDFKDISPQIFGPKLLNTVERISYWVAFIRKKMPAKDPNSNVTKEERGKGMDIRFGKEGSYPTFLLEKAVISSTVSEDTNKGSVSGQIRGVNSDPSVYGKPTTVNLRAEFPRSNIYGALISVVIDHTKPKPSDRLLIQVKSFPVSEFSITESSDISLGIERSTARAKLAATFLEKKMSAKTSVTLNEVQYGFSSPIPTVRKTLDRVLKGLSTVSVLASVSGPYEDPKLSVTSDLGKKLASGFKEEFRHQIGALNEAIRKKVTDQVSAEKNKATAKLNELKAKALNPVNEKLAKVRQMKQQADNAINKVKQEGQNALKKQAGQKVKKQFDQIKKKIKIPGF